MKRTLSALAQLTNINIKEAKQVTRHHPLLNEEINIEEELVNLEEAFSTYETAAKTLKQYPQLSRHMVVEQRTILKHCVGLVARMIQGKSLPRKYDHDDISYALMKLVRLIVREALRVGKRIDKETLHSFEPYLTPRQRLKLGLGVRLDPKLYWQLTKQAFNLLLEPEQV